MNIAAIVLAAGSAARFGSDKRLHLIDGVPMLTRTLTTYRAVFDAVATVIRPGESEIAELVRFSGCRVVEAKEAVLGQSRSLAAGVAAVTTRHQPVGGHDASGPDVIDGVIIGLADMPFVKSRTLKRLAEAMTDHPGAIVRPRYNGRAGNPVGFPQRMFGDLLRLEGDAGARQLVATDNDLVFVGMDDSGILRDVDRPIPTP